ncbi:MAG: GTP-binding protein [Rhodobacteraceae bacterium]|nr:GTP-binding protein [Paracoccaceae bacterium]
MSSSTDPRLPLTILTGFLGAGKTTLLDRVLKDASNGRVAVIVNEFGEAGLDQDLIHSVDGDVTLMSSGCLCCSVRGELPATVLRLLEKREAGNYEFERIVIETTGLADPSPIFQTIATDPSLARHVRLDGIVTVVDAAHGAQTLDTQFEAVSQASMADLLILSKTDLAHPALADAMVARLKGLNPTAPIRRISRGEVEPSALWDLTKTRSEAPMEEAIAWTTERAEPVGLGPLAGLASGLPDFPGASGTANLASMLTGSGATPHDGRISSASIVLDTPLTDEVFDRWLKTLTALKGRDLLRVKGIVFLEGIDLPFVFHGVQTIFERPRPLTTWTGDDRRSRIVVIARDMTRPELQRSLDMLRAQAAPKA